MENCKIIVRAYPFFKSKKENYIAVKLRSAFIKFFFKKRLKYDYFDYKTKTKLQRKIYNLRTKLKKEFNTFMYILERKPELLFKGIEDLEFCIENKEYKIEYTAGQNYTTEYIWLIEKLLENIKYLKKNIKNRRI